MREQVIYRLIGRRLLDMTQGQVAIRCGLTFQQVQKYEAGITAMPLARLVALAEVLRAPIEMLVQGLCQDDVPSTDEARAGRQPLSVACELVA